MFRHPAELDRNPRSTTESANASSRWRTTGRLKARKENDGSAASHKRRRQTPEVRGSAPASRSPTTTATRNPRRRTHPDVVPEDVARAQGILRDGNRVPNPTRCTKCERKSKGGTIALEFDCYSVVRNKIRSCCAECTVGAQSCSARSVPVDEPLLEGGWWTRGDVFARRYAQLQALNLRMPDFMLDHRGPFLEREDLVHLCSVLVRLNGPERILQCGTDPDRCRQTMAYNLLVDENGRSREVTAPHGAFVARCLGIQITSLRHTECGLPVEPQASASVCIVAIGRPLLS